MLRLKKTKLGKMLRQRRDAGSLPTKAEYERGPGRRKAKGIVETHAGTPIDQCAKQHHCRRCTDRVEEIEEQRRQEQAMWQALQQREVNAQHEWDELWERG